MREGGAGDGCKNNKAMQEWICRENIVRLRRQRQTSLDERQRAILSDLIAEHEAQLEQLIATPKR